MNKKLAFAALALTAALTGCNSNSKQASAKAPLNPSITEISPTPPAPSYTAAVQPIQPLAAQPVEPAPAAFTGAGAASAAGKYTVLKGDTLFKIARERYGDGKQWNRIAAANPGLTPQNLKAGQKIVIP